ncbi:MAG TPA: DUF488 domain-containing protein [Isosphaeraceae bacterium]|jgi:uncharacterized protein (DUF488 family)|nr:DUF488 domain-containing protein [Isosphaeraceae bacterium]
MTRKTIWTIGHSTRSLADFVALLQDEKVMSVADVRRFPASRRHSHFSKEELAEGLRRGGIRYLHLGDLGGRRSGLLAGSPNTGWRVEAFNAYADYMATPAFEASLAELTVEAEHQQTAIMCAEALPWRCHRRLIADALIVRGWSVIDIIGAGKVEPHQLTEFARVDGTRLTYPAEPLFTGE